MYKMDIIKAICTMSTERNNARNLPSLLPFTRAGELKKLWLIPVVFNKKEKANPLFYVLRFSAKPRVGIFVSADVSGNAYKRSKRLMTLVPCKYLQMAKSVLEANGKDGYNLYQPVFMADCLEAARQCHVGLRDFGETLMDVLTKNEIDILFMDEAYTLNSYLSVNVTKQIYFCEEERLFPLAYLMYYPINEVLEMIRNNMFVMPHLALSEEERGLFEEVDKDISIMKRYPKEVLGGIDRIFKGHPPLADFVKFLDEFLALRSHLYSLTEIQDIPY